MTRSTASRHSSPLPLISDVLDDLLRRAKQAGADAADAIGLDNKSVEVSQRMGKLENVERSESTAFGLRVLLGKKQAFVSASDPSVDARQLLVERAIAMAKAAPPDPWACLAPPALLSDRRDAGSLDLYDTTWLSEDALKALTAEAEDAALAVAGVTNSGGAGASVSHSSTYFTTSTGFQGSYKSSSFSLSVSAVAGTGTTMERDYDFTSTRHFSDMDKAATIGRNAGERALRRLGATRAKTERLPVVFDPRVANSLLGHFAQAINGMTITRGTSFLQNALDTAVFAPGIHIHDNPERPRGLRSRPFDAEGVKTRPLTLVEDGVLKSWVLDCSTAAQCDLETTGSASRSIAGPPSPGTTNLYMAPGALSPEELIGSIEHGVYITELIGMGVNPVTGDYSRGAAGFMIENGTVTGAINEITIAGNLKDMFARLTPANDLAFRYAINAPTLLVDGMSLAGS